MTNAIGQEIASRRKILGLTQKQLAKAIGVTVNFISLIENGRRGMTLEVMGRMAKRLGCRWKLVSTDSLIGRGKS